MTRVYMDANATTPVAPEVVEAMRPYWTEQFGNASSVHRFGQNARAAVEHARRSVARMLGARDAEIVFTSGGTESDNAALFGMAGAHLAGGRPLAEFSLVTSTIEHDAVLNAAKRLEKRGAHVSYVAVGADGAVHADKVRAALAACPPGSAKLVSVMLANNETGVLQPLAEIAAVAKEFGALTHTDAVQAAGKVPIDVNSLGVDLLSISGHKMHAPQGTGALFVRRGVLLEPLFFGGNHERQRRAGTENLPGIVGLGAAAEMALRDFAADRDRGIAAMRDRLEAGIVAAVENCGVNGAASPRVPNTTDLWFDGVEGEPLVIALDLKGLAVSSGAACSSGAIEPSHVLTAMGLSAARARSSLRISLGKQNTQADVDFALSVVPAAVRQIRAVTRIATAR